VTISHLHQLRSQTQDVPLCPREERGNIVRKTGWPLRNIWDLSSALTISALCKKQSVKKIHEQFLEEKMEN